MAQFLPSLRPHLPAVLVFIVVVLCYLPSLFNPFVHYDDFVYIVENPLVTSPHTKSTLKTIWASPYEQNFVPLLWTTFRSLFAVFRDSPLPYHTLSLLLHAANPVLVLLISRKQGLSLLPA